MAIHTDRAPRPRPAPGPLRAASPLVLALALAACGADGDDSESVATAGASEVLPTDTAPGVSTARGTGDASLPAAEVEQGRNDDSWRQFVDVERTSEADTTPNPESWEDISAATANQDRTHVPLSGDVAGPSVLTLQVLLDRAMYRPGVIDGRWGKNTEKAVYWMQEAEGLEPTGTADEATFQRLRELAGVEERIVVAHEVTAEDIEGPFVDIPDDIYDKAELDCLCYESRAEQLAERFHTTPELLEQLNPDVDLLAVGAGERLQVPNVEPFSFEDAPDDQAAGATPVAEIVISDGGHYLQTRDADGNLLHHFPSTLGADYAPSPTGEYSIDSIHQDPAWHYKPDLLSGVDPSRPDATLPAGPNNAVGVVWMQLSRPHYGIHGTSAPETIGYATSHGCVRLTNWDAEFLSHHVEAGVPVRFIDGTGRAAEG